MDNKIQYVQTKERYSAVKRNPMSQHRQTLQHHAGWVKDPPRVDYFLSREPFPLLPIYLGHQGENRLLLVKRSPTRPQITWSHVLRPYHFCQVPGRQTHS